MSEKMAAGMSEGVGTGESRARAAADLVLGAELLPGPVPLPDFASLMAAHARWRRRGFTLGIVSSLGVVALVATLLVWERAPISYVVDGTVAIADGVIDAAGAPGNLSASVRFSEGTQIGLAPGARLRVIGRSARGAALALDRGRARFSVTPRSGARWSVATGPFTVEVVGTKFLLDWSPRDERLVVDLIAGSVMVRGASVGGPVAMHPGERLIATAADRRVTLSPLAETRRRSESLAGWVDGEQDGEREQDDEQPADDVGLGGAAGDDRGDVVVASDGDGDFGNLNAVAAAIRPSRRGGHRGRLALASPVRAATAPGASVSKVAAGPATGAS
ncbi:MAG: FecR family protein, partial [Bacteroidota bacterium]